MCAIFGSLNLQLNENEIIKSLHSMKHRGPDSNGIYKDKNNKFSLFFGHNRLEILDIKNGTQPMISEDGNYVVVYNGEIYNFKELRKDLENLGHKFFTDHSDTEILIHGYKQWKNDLPKYLNGMWAFAIYDKSKSQIFFSRDRFGEKPFFYYFKNNTFVFASELSAITNFKNLDLELNNTNLKKYCAYGFFPFHLTPYKNINKLQAGYNLILNIASMNLSKYNYWDYKIEPDFTVKENEWCEQIYTLLDKSVKDRLVADVPVGVFLSGGLDSSIISLLSKKYLGEKMNTFSIKFGESSFDETKYANFVSEKINSNHHHQTINSDNMQNVWEEFFSKVDEPISDSSLLSYYLLCKFSKKKIKVALGGDAADELLAGYDTFKALRYAKLIGVLKLNKLTPIINSVISKLPTSYSYMNLKFKLERFFRFSGHELGCSHGQWLSPLNSNEIEEIFEEKTTNDELYSESIDLWNKNNYLNNIDKSLEFYTKIFLQDQILVKTDRLSMMNSLEVRSPFLDLDLVNCIRKIPWTLKLNGNISKYILKKAFEKNFGKKFTYRKKIGFSAPISKHLLKKDINFKLKSKLLKNKNVFFEKKLLEHRLFKKENRIYLWNILNLDNFLNKNEH